MRSSNIPSDDDIIVNTSDIDDFDYDEVLKFLQEEEENGIESHASDSEEDLSEDEVELELPKPKKIKEESSSKKEDASHKRKQKTTKSKTTPKKTKKKEKDTDYKMSQSEDEEEEELAKVKPELEDDSDKENNNNAKKKKTKAKRASKRKTKDEYILAECELDDETLESDIKWKPVTSSPPKDLSPDIKMLRFQLESLTWLGEQEENPRFRGGILADDMGMGKTLQAIALLLSRKAPEDEKVKATLVICPVVALTQWQNEITKYTKPDSLKVTVYHGSSRITDAEELSKYDVVLTSYSIVETEWRHQQTGYKRKGETIKKPSLVHSIAWYRVILDEAHSIKDRNSNSARAVFNLQSQYKLTLTGTPLQNRIGELFSIIKFLRVVPYSYYYCKKCECKSHSWLFEPGHSRGRKCLQCDHSAMSHFAWWNKNVMNPIGMNHDRSKRAIKVLKYILTQLMLRRTKVEKAQDMCLPPRVITVRNDQLDALENDFYEALYTQSQTQFNDFVEQGTILNNYAHVFDLLLRLRQAVDHPYLVLHSKDRSEDKGSEWCGICHEISEDPIQSRCKHTFCRTCIETFVTSAASKKPDCPTCFIPLTIDLKQKTLEMKAETKGKTILQRIDLTNWRSSTKIEAVMEELEKTKSRDPNAKTLIFSQFVNFLDLIEWRLKLAGFGCVKLDGRMNSQQKDAAIQKFNTDPDTRVFLISLKAGGVALNLTAASQCFLLDPWWNPAAEFQAIDRVYRLGQYKCISVIRFIIPNTIEDRIMQLQEKKHLLFNSTVGMDQDALARLSLGDLKFLFRC